jgi:hypothetical protein
MAQKFVSRGIETVRWNDATEGRPAEVWLAKCDYAILLLLYPLATRLERPCSDYLGQGRPATNRTGGLLSSLCAVFAVVAPRPDSHPLKHVRSTPGRFRVFT